MGELYSSKNSRQFVRLRKTGRTILLKSKRAQEQERTLAKQLDVYFDDWVKMVGMQRPPYFVCFYVYRKTYRKWDWTNIIQGIADAMVAADYLEDDNAYEFVPIFVGWEVDKNCPRTEIWVVKDLEGALAQP